MNNPIYTTTLKLIENLKNSKGKYSEKNQFLVDIANKCISLKGIGCNFVLNVEFGKDDTCFIGGGNKSDFHNANKILKMTEISNFLSNLSITMKDRAFVITHNAKNQACIFCIDFENFRHQWKVSEKNAIDTRTTPIKNIFTGGITLVTETVSKGKRDLNNDDIANVTTAFNAMLGRGYNKELATTEEKNVKNA